MSKKRIYRVIFQYQGNIIELYAHRVAQQEFYAFVEVSDIIFGERSKLVLDPSEEQLKAQFAGVKCTYIPLYAVMRIDEVDKEGTAKVVPLGEQAKGKVTPFPLIVTPPGSHD